MEKQLDLLQGTLDMPKLHAAAGGKYGAFPFATALVLGAAEVITLKSSTLAPGRLVGRRFLIDS